MWPCSPITRGPGLFAYIPTLNVTSVALITNSFTPLLHSQGSSVRALVHREQSPTIILHNISKPALNVLVDECPELLAPKVRRPVLPAPSIFFRLSIGITERGIFEWHEGDGGANGEGVRFSGGNDEFRKFRW